MVISELQKEYFEKLESLGMNVYVSDGKGHKEFYEENKKSYLDSTLLKSHKQVNHRLRFDGREIIFDPAYNSWEENAEVMTKFINFCNNRAIPYELIYTAGVHGLRSSMYLDKAYSLDQCLAIYFWLCNKIDVDPKTHGLPENAQKHHLLGTIGRRRKVGFNWEYSTWLSEIPKERPKIILPSDIRIPNKIELWVPPSDALNFEHEVISDVGDYDTPLAEIDKDPEFEILTPDDHFITRYIHLLEKLTDAYPEYHLSVVLSLLSTIANRRIFINIKPHGGYTNLWFVNLGDSTVSRKTTSVRFIEILLQMAGLGRLLLPKDFSPEALVAELADKPRGCFFRDEAGGFLAVMSKKYGQGLGEILCNLYDCPPEYSRKLRKETLSLKDVYLTLLWATTPTAFARNSTTDDLETGFFARMLFTFPRRKKGRKDLEEIDPQESKEQLELAKWLTEIYLFIQKYEIKMHLSKEALLKFNQWQAKCEDLIQEHENPSRIAPFYGRAAEFAIKIAALLQIGSSDFREKFTNNSENFTNIKEEENQQAEQIRNSVKEKVHIIHKVNSDNSQTSIVCEECEPVNFVKDLMIEDTHIDIAIKYISELFIPYMMRVVELVENYSQTDQLQLVYSIVCRKGRIQRSDLLRLAHMKSREFTEVINTLIESRRVRTEQENTQTKPKIYYVALDPTRKHKPTQTIKAYSDKDLLQKIKSDFKAIDSEAHLTLDFLCKRYSTSKSQIKEFLAQLIEDRKVEEFEEGKYRRLALDDKTAD